MTEVFGRMLRRYSILLIVTSVATTMQATDSEAASAFKPQGGAPAAPSAGAPTLPGLAIVRGSVAKSTLRDLGASVTRRIPSLGATEISFPGDFKAVARILRSRGLRAERVFAGRIASTETCFAPGCVAPQWHHAATLASDLADTNTSRIRVAVLDTRLDMSHPDWIPATATGADVSQGGQLSLSDAREYVSNHTGAAAYHGTFVAGLLAAAINNVDAAGAAPNSVTILPYAVVDGGGSTDSTTLATAILDAWKAKARIINLSLGVLGDSATLRDALRVVTTGNATYPASLVIAAAGNNTGNAAFYPGSYPEVMSAAGTAENDTAASCSNFNSNVSVSAPADRLVGLAPMPQRMLVAPCGTSAAAPQVSALAARLLASNPALTTPQVRSIIETSADDLGPAGRDDRFGHGRINFSRALAASSSLTVATPARTISARDGKPSISVTATGSQSRVQGVRARISNKSFDLSASDGAFGSYSESASGTIDLSGLTPGVHRLMLEASDGVSYGKATSAVVIIDSVAPVLTNVTAPSTVRAASDLVVTFNASDAVASEVIAGVQIRSTGTAATASVATGWEPNGSHSVSIALPVNLTPGHYTVTVAVADPSGNVSRAEAGTFIV